LIPELPPERLRWACDLKIIGAKSTEELKPLEVIVGQPRAHEALLFGFEVKEAGFNIFASGPPATGKTTMTMSFLKENAKKRPAPPDWCYIQNFEDEYQPKTLRCPTGLGKQLKQDMRELIQAARVAIPQIFEGEDYAAKRDTILRKINQKREETVSKMSEEAKSEGFAMQLTALGISVVPLVKGRPISEDDFLSLPKETQLKLTQKREELHQKLTPLLRQLRQVELQTHEEIDEFDRNVALYAIEHLTSTLLEKYKEHSEIKGFLNAMQSHILDRLDLFRGRRVGRKDSAQDDSPDESDFRVFEVNVIVDNSAANGAPVILDQNPTYDNLFGRIEKESVQGNLTTDFTLIRGGTLHRANGGYLILRAEQILRDQNLKHLDTSAVARLIEHSSRLAEDQDKLSTQFGLVADVVREAHFYATQDDSKFVTVDHVEKAIEAKIYRSNLIQEKLREYIQRGVIFISTEGVVVGQINGLSVLNVGDFSFGAPSRITVAVGLGKEGLIDVQREVDMSGPIHGKGVMIIAGYLASKFALDKPLTLSARIVFEQNYEGVEGDSASSTELYALLSALSGVGIKQNFAVTGSVNQKGEIQPIGGANEKIEGYFEVCKSRGLNGGQGVLIPENNVRNLMLKKEVVDAVSAGKFHIFPVKTIEEGIEILTGTPAGKRLQDGTYEKDTIYDQVDRRLREMAETSRRFQTIAP
jgi:predicted ATP-dependent protease